MLDDEASRGGTHGSPRARRGPAAPATATGLTVAVAADRCLVAARRFREVGRLVVEGLDVRGEALLAPGARLGGDVLELLALLGEHAPSLVHEREAGHGGFDREGAERFRHDGDRPGRADSDEER